jgi:hypothetical protein
MNSFDLWLRKQVLKLEHEICTNGVLEGDSAPTRDELLELRRLTVIHRFLYGNLQQMETRHQTSVASLDKARTREVELREDLSQTASR